MTADSANHFSRSTIYVLMPAYCVVLFLTLDFIYSSFIYNHGSNAWPGVRNEVYDHGFSPNFAGIQTWGRLRYWLYTNNLGFKDAEVRMIPTVAAVRRILVIGDSFTEAIGLRFEDSYVGMLYAAGQHANSRVEFLNAGISGYSPTLYYRKIKFLLDRGIKFDEVLVALDSGDVPREATAYFCFDNDPSYRAHCNKDYEAQQPVPVTTRRSLENRIKGHFIVTDMTRLLIKNAVLDWRDTRNGAASVLPRVLESSIVTGWPMRARKIDRKLAPLGVEGGILRALKNMQRVADLLAESRIGLTVSVHPWPIQLAEDDRNSRAVEIWQSFCAKNCKAFIDLFPAFFAYKDAHADWYERLFIYGDVHYSVEGNRLMFRELAKHLL
jgi:hypothetical protein